MALTPSEFDTAREYALDEIASIESRIEELEEALVYDMLAPTEEDAIYDELEELDEKKAEAEDYLREISEDYYRKYSS